MATIRLPSGDQEDPSPSFIARRQLLPSVRIVTMSLRPALFGSSKERSRPSGDERAKLDDAVLGTSRLADVWVSTRYIPFGARTASIPFCSARVGGPPMIPPQATRI